MPPRKRLRRQSNKRRPERDRKPKSAKQMLEAQAQADSAQPLTIPVTWLKLFIGIFLVPVCIITTKSFLLLFHTAADSGSVLMSEELWFFCMGSLMWVIVFFGFKKPTYLYVLGHELTHAIFVKLCGGQVSDWNVTKDGGYIVTNKTNFLISLSPYFVPLWTIVTVLLVSVVHLIVEIPWYSRIVFALIGVTWTFHFMYTIWMITKNQPDLRENGTFFSLTLIYWINLLLICGLLVIVSPVVGWGAFFQSMAAYGQELLNATGDILADLLG